MSFKISFKPLTISTVNYMLDQALNWPMTPALATSNYKEFF